MEVMGQSGNYNQSPPGHKNGEAIGLESVQNRSRDHSSPGHENGKVVGQYMRTVIMNTTTW